MAKPRQLGPSEALLHSVSHDIKSLEAGGLSALLPAMAAAQREVEHELAHWIRLLGPNAAQLKFTAAHLRQVKILLGVAQAQGTVSPKVPFPHMAMKAVKIAMGKQEAPAKAVNTLAFELGVLRNLFHDLPRLQLIEAATLAKGDKLALTRYASSANRYAGQVRDDLKFQFGVGLSRGETVFQLAKRISNVSSFRQAVDLSLPPVQTARAMSSALAQRYTHWASRLVRTELVNAYNQTADIGIKAAAKLDSRIVKKWDASLDARVCVDCSYMHGKTIEPGGVFKGRRFAAEYPPLHPNCRCAIVAWIEEWAGAQADDLDSLT